MAGCSPFNVIDNTENLDKELGTFCKNLQVIRTKSDEWVEMWMKARRKVTEEHEKVDASYQDQIKKLKKQIEEQSSQTEDMKDILKRLENLEEAKQKLESEVLDEKRKITEQTEKNEAFAKDIVALEKVIIAKEEKVSKGMAFFKERLALEFQTIKGEDKMKVVFTKVDEINQKREFFFDTQIVNSKYIISNCIPNICQLDAYVEELNASNDFTRFVIKMRKAFKNSLVEHNNQNIPANVM